MDLDRGLELVIIDEAVCADDAKTVFGRRWGGQMFRLEEHHLAALRQGRYVALDIQDEYVAYLQFVPREGA
jgi:predicted protein tyrosine phosphatase